MERFKYLGNILIVALLFAAIAIGRDSRIVGYSVSDFFSEQTLEEVALERKLPDGTLVLNSTSLAKDVIGFGGRTPIEVYVKDGVITKVEALNNSETPSFMADIHKSGLLCSWDSLSLADATLKSVDVVSGATYTSVALIENVKRVASYGSDVEVSAGLFNGFSLKTLFGILVILMGVILSIAAPKRKIYKSIQMWLNVLVLGFWCGSFLSLSQIVSWLSNGFNLSMAIVSIMLLLVVVILPLFGKKGTYCSMHCPLGSAQELVGKTVKKKWKIKPNTVKKLHKLRYYILLILMLLMWLGLGFDLINYEAFSAFLLGSASVVVLVMAGIFMVLSLFIPRPYCRFICPTGALITIMQKTKE